MRAIQLRCPNCGASLDAPETAETITCSYCQTTSRVRARTRIFEAPVSLPARPQFAQLPIAVQQHTRRWVAGSLVSTILLIGLTTAVPFCIVKKVRKAATGHDGVTGRTLNWGSPIPMAIDVNGDGVADLVGRLRGLDGVNSVHLVAFDGASGKKLWQSPKLGSYQETYQGTVAALEKRLVFVNDRGLARGFSLADGTQSWKVNILEKLQAACVGDGGVFLLTADERWIKLDTEAGKANEVKAPTSCRPLATDGRGQKPIGTREIDAFNRVDPKPDKFDGMSISMHVILDSDGKGRERLALGSKSPGTAVPMVARYSVENFDPPEAPVLSSPEATMSKKAQRQLRRERSRHERKLRSLIAKAEFPLAWKTAVPSRDPLGAKSSRLEIYGLSREADCVVIPYERRNKPIHVACISYKTGKHRWDIALPKAFIDSLDGMVVRGKRAYIGMSSRVHAIDLDTGKRLFSVGQNN